MEIAAMPVQEVLEGRRLEGRRVAGRRLAFLSALSLTVLLGACSTLGAIGALLGNEVTFTAPQLQGYLDRRFPREYEKLGGLVTMSLLNPRLSIPQGGTRLQLDFDIGVGGFGRDSRVPAGHFALQSGLRFDLNTRGLHLDNPAITRVDVPALGGSMNSNARSALNRWLVDYARDEPVYQLDENLLGRMAGRRIGTTSIGNGVVTLHLDQ
jgi:hypothetical protein